MGLINKINVGGTDYDVASGINITLTMNAETGFFNPISAEDIEKLTTGLMQGASKIIGNVTMGDMSYSMCWYYINSSDNEHYFMEFGIGSNGGVLASISPNVNGINISTGVISMYTTDLTINTTKVM